VLASKITDVFQKAGDTGSLGNGQKGDQLKRSAMSVLLWSAVTTSLLSGSTQEIRLTKEEFIYQNLKRLLESDHSVEPTYKELAPAMHEVGQNDVTSFEMNYG